MAWRILLHISAILFRKRLKGLNLYLVSATMDRRAERFKMNSLIRQEVNAFIRSSRSYTETAIDRLFRMEVKTSLKLELEAKRGPEDDHLGL